jgi:tetrahydromethanopterin S-methyltransferase subunit F
MINLSTSMIIVGFVFATLLVGWLLSKIIANKEVNRG